MKRNQFLFKARHARTSEAPIETVAEDTSEGQQMTSAEVHLPFEAEMPSFSGATAWLNSPPLSAAGLRGNVVLIDFWTYTCINWLRRRWCPLGERPPWIVQDAYEWLSLYAAVEPTTGTGVFLLLPTVEGQCLEMFLRHLRHELGRGPIGVVLDSSGSHRSGEVRWPRGMHPLYLPPYSPELNPAEQVFQHIRKHLSNTVFTTLDELQNALIDELQQFWEHPTVLLQLTSYPWWVDAVK